MSSTMFDKVSDEWVRITHELESLDRKPPKTGYAEQRAKLIRQLENVDMLRLGTPSPVAAQGLLGQWFGRKRPSEDGNEAFG